jgi:hypothetical protein
MYDVRREDDKSTARTRGKCFLYYLLVLNGRYR